MASIEWTTDGAPLVGLVDEATAVDADSGRQTDLESIVAGAGGDVATGPIDVLLERDLSMLVAVGDSALLAAVRIGVDVPVLPVDAGRGVRSVPSNRLPAALESVVDGSALRQERPILVADSGDDRARALLDVTLVTDEPARISEYALRSRSEAVSQFRADGVVVATAAGSYGYASDASGPLLAPGVEGVAVVPVGPFVTKTRRWILPDDDLSLSVEREGTVALLADGQTAATLTAASTVTISADETLSTLVVPESPPFFDAHSSA